MRTRTVAWLGGLLLVATTGACSDSDDGGGEPGEIAGSITVITHRTDLVDTLFVEYVERFNQTYPDVEVEFEALTDYEGEISIRMNTEDYGDVLHIPNSVVPADLATFFEPLGTVEELGQTYRYIEEQAFEGTVYGIATFGNAQGFVYNKRIFEEAGVTEWPTTPDEFVDALRLVQENTDAIPYYTNYSAGWPLVQWENHRGSISADPEYVNQLAHTDEPWAPGTDHYVIDSLLYDIVASGLIEEDPTTTDWEASKGLLGRGEIASMSLGSWAIIQMQEAADNPDDIGFLPFPSTDGGMFFSTTGGDYKAAINRHSDNKAAARAWLDFFVDESGYAADSGAISPLLADPLPAQLEEFASNGVELIEQNPASADEQGLVNNIDNEAEVGLFQPNYRQRIVDAARGATDESLEEIFADLNARWSEAQAELAGG